MSQLARRANTFCGCCSDAQKYAINSISQAIRLQASKRSGGRAHRVALTCSKKQNPSLACKLELGNNFSLDLAAQPVCNILCCIVAASAPFLPQIQATSATVLAVILLPLATSGSCAGKQAEAGTGSAFKEPQMLPANATCHLDQTERVVQVFQKFHSRFLSLSNTHKNTPSFAYLKWRDLQATRRDRENGLAHKSNARKEKRMQKKKKNKKEPSTGCLCGSLTNLPPIDKPEWWTTGLKFKLGRTQQNNTATRRRKKERKFSRLKII